MTEAQQKVVLFLSLLLTFIFFLAHPSLFLPQGSASFVETTAPAKTGEEKITIEVDGSVNRRGTYTLENGTTVGEAVEKAGGVAEKLSFPPEAFTRTVNQNSRLQILSSGKGEGQIAIEPLAAPKLRVLGIPVNINTATVEDLDALPGIGPKTAQAIVEYREIYGRFEAPEDLLKISGIGKKKLEALRKHIVAQ